MKRVAVPVYGNRSHSVAAAVSGRGSKYRGGTKGRGISQVFPAHQCLPKPRPLVDTFLSLFLPYAFGPACEYRASGVSLGSFSPRPVQVRRMQSMNERTCTECVYCTRKNKSTQRGICIEEHSPRNAKGEPQKIVYLWATSCPYFAEELPKILKKSKRGRKND